MKHKHSHKLRRWGVMALLLLGSGKLHAQALSGAYTIDPAGSGANNFTTFSAAMSALSSKGVNGPVVIKVAPGTYTEQVTIGNISGTSASNTITIDGGTASSVTLEYSSNSSNSLHTFQFGSNCQYVRLRNITILGKGTSYGWGVHMNNNVSNIRISRCVVKVDSVNTSGSQYVAGMVLSSSTNSPYSGATCNNIEIDSNYVGGGTTSMWLSGSGSNSKNVFVRGNKMSNPYQYGVYLNSVYDFKFLNNDISATANRYQYGTGMQLFNAWTTSGGSIEVSGNRIYQFGQYGIYTSSFGASATGTWAIFANNMVGGGFRSTNAHGMYLNYATGLKIYHNTIVMDGPATSGTVSAALYVYDYNNQTRNEAVNNNLVVLKNGSGINSVAAYLSPGFTFSKIDYNNLYNEADSNGVAFIDGYYDLKTYKGGGGFNKNSFSKKPVFINNGTNLHYGTGTALLTGDPGIGIQYDIDGDVRCSASPSLGADEIKPTNIVLTPGISGPDTVSLGAPVLLRNATVMNVGGGFSWIYNDSLRSKGNELWWKFNKQGWDSIRLEVSACHGPTKSVWKRVFVKFPNNRPKSDFFSDVNSTYRDGIVNFTDASTGGAATWQWEIKPMFVNDPVKGYIKAYQYINGTDSTSRNPEVRFTAVGNFTICQSTFNAKGPGNKVCKSAYIKVVDGFDLCSSTKFSTNPSGFIFDNGGHSANYSANSKSTTCNFRISPCAADKVVLRFRQFDLKTNDYLRIYDGDDASGTPLYSHARYPYGLTGGIGSGFFPDSFVAKSGRMYIEFESDNNTGTVGQGWQAYWISTVPASAAPVVKFEMPDTVCSGSVVGFKVTSPAASNDLKYSWDFDGDGMEDDNRRDVSYLFYGTDSMPVSLSITQCGITTAITKWLKIEEPTAVPDAEFTSDLTRAATDDIVNFTNLSTGCVAGSSWKIYPSTYTMVNGTGGFSKNVSVKFNAPGTYDVRLQVFNDVGEDSIYKVGHITIYDYCAPSLIGSKSDIGINRVRIRDIDNSTTTTASGYTNYGNTYSVNLERGSTYDLTVERNAAVNSVTVGAWIDFNNDGDFEDPSELVGKIDSSTGFVWKIAVKIPVLTQLGGTRMRIGVVNYTGDPILPCGPASYGEYEDYRVIIINDKVAPEITLNGADTVTLEYGSTYNDLGATATDNIDGNITNKIVVVNAVDPYILGPVLVFYSVSDQAGNKTTVTRTVIVTPDATKPVAKLTGKDTAYIEVNQIYTDEGATGTDNIDGNNVTIETFSDLDNTTLGTYYFTYKISDQSGNFVNVTRTLIVIDTTAPVPVFMTGNTRKVEVGRLYTDEDFSVVDNYAKGKVTVTKTGTFLFPNNVPTRLGTYTLDYTVADESGNTATITRTIQVIDTTAPIVRLKGAERVKINRWATYTDAGYTVTDNYDKAPVVTTGGDFVNTMLAGIYHVTYTAKDSSNNTSVTVTRVVEVEEPLASGISDASGTNVRVDAFPNPTQGLLNIVSVLPQGEQVLMTLTDVMGRELQVLYNGMSQGEMRVQADLSTQAAGIYFVRIQCGNKVGFARISVQR